MCVVDRGGCGGEQEGMGARGRHKEGWGENVVFEYRDAEARRLLSGDVETEKEEGEARTGW